MNKDPSESDQMLETEHLFRSFSADEEFVDASGDRRVTTSSPRSISEQDRFSGDQLPNDWFSWHKYVCYTILTDLLCVVCTG